MKFTDIFLRKPVLAIVVSLFIFLVGLRSGFELNVRQFPEIKNAVVTVSTVYIGADADLIQGFITTPLEREIAAAEGIDYIVSNSLPGVSVIQAYLRLDADPNESLTQISAQVNKVRSDLPAEAEDTVLDLAVGQTIAAMYLSFYSDVLDNSQITDYLVRVIEPQLSTIPGVQRAEILGDRTFAMRAWLDPERMAALDMTTSEVFAALGRNNVLSAVGRTKGSAVSIDLKADTDLRSPEAFRRLVLRGEGETLVRLEDIATVELGAENYDTVVTFDGESATFMGIQVAPDANALDVIARVRDVWHNELVPQFPEGLIGAIPYDSTEYIESAIDEVIITIVLALIIVIVVIFLFLGSLRSVLIPAVAVPLSMVGTLTLMLLFGFSINLLTLLAMVLAIGIVVDDAIIVLENVQRHIEDGMKPFDAAIQGARELAGPIIVMSTTLIAVYLPIGFVGGLTGTLFTEFAFTLAASVVISGVIALTLSPMMCAKILKSHEAESGGLAAWLDRRFESLRNGYQRSLNRNLDARPVLLVFGLIILVSCYFLFVTSAQELEPQEDTGFILAIAEADPYTTIEGLAANTRLMNDIAESTPEMRNLFLLNGVGAGGGAGATNSAIAGFVLKPWDQRERSTKQVLEQTVQAGIDAIPGTQTFVFSPPSLPSPGGGPPVQFVIGSTQPLSQMQEVADAMVGRAYASGRFIFADSDLKVNKPRMDIVIDRDKAGLLGVSMDQISADLAAGLSGGFAGRFSLDNRSYRVIPQVSRSQRLNPDQLKDLYTRANDGTLIPLSTLVSLEPTVQPQRLNRFQQLNAVTISGVPRPGVALGDALKVLEDAAAEVLPPGYVVDYAGESRQFKTEGSQLIVTFFFALVIIYLVLAAQFESFRDPLVILVTVPMAVCGAMIFVSMGATSVNIYTQVGLVTLIGLISKHGILIVEFANQLQKQGRSKREAIEEAAALRLRPILMTTAATVLAMVPLLIATGAGAGSRFAMGIVIAAGMTIGTFFTLYIVPAMYSYLSRDLHLQQAQSDETVATAT